MKLPNQRNGLELGDIFREYGPAYRETHSLSPEQRQAMNAIEACRTKALGGHLEVCTSCGAEFPAYDSCRNRHCPKCGWMAKEKWLRKRKEELLPVTYFHVVFTISDLLNPIALQNQQVMYDILFKAGSETLLDLGKDPKHLGGDIGFMAILHILRQAQDRLWGYAMIDPVR